METKQLPSEPPSLPDITAQSALLRWYEQEQQASLQHLKEILNHPAAKAVSEAHQVHQKEQSPELGFNVFSIVTDTYKKRTCTAISFVHSWTLKQRMARELLSCNSKHIQLLGYPDPWIKS